MPTARDRLIRVLSRIRESGETCLFLLEARPTAAGAGPPPPVVRSPSHGGGSRPRPASGPGSRAAPTAPEPRAPGGAAPDLAAGAAPDTPEERWLALEKAVTGCRRCRLCESRTQAVFGSGTRRTRLFIVGEGPGAQEDLRGEAFVGAAGELLTKILAAIGFGRDEVFITNVVKCRPPGNRTPQPDEVQACASYLDDQIDLVRPVAILSLGASAARRLLATPMPIGRLRGRVHLYRGISVVPTYHPAALLRSPEYKRPTWEDVQLLRRVYDERLAELGAGAA